VSTRLNITFCHCPDEADEWRAHGKATTAATKVNNGQTLDLDGQVYEKPAKTMTECLKRLSTDMSNDEPIEKCGK
jgi:hypothetical protein